MKKIDFKEKMRIVRLYASPVYLQRDIDLLKSIKLKHPLVTRIGVSDKDTLFVLLDFVEIDEILSNRGEVNAIQEKPIKSLPKRKRKVKKDKVAQTGPKSDKKKVKTKRGGVSKHQMDGVKQPDGSES